MTRFTTRRPAPANCRFDLLAFVGELGRAVDIGLPDGSSAPARVVAVVVDSDGRGVEFTFETVHPLDNLSSRE